MATTAAVDTVGSLATNSGTTLMRWCYLDEVRATVRDVARRAGVSPKTVSNVVNGTFPVNASTRGRVEAAMVELEYVPNLSARALRNGRSGVVTLALPDLATAYSAEVTHHFVAAARQRGLSVQIEETTGAESERQLLSQARAQLVDGLILNPVRLETSAVQVGVALPPVVLIGEVEQPVADHVWLDNVAACQEMTELLIAQGHRTIAVLGVMETETSRVREQGFRQGLNCAGQPWLPQLRIHTRDWSAAAGAEALRGYLRTHEVPDAIFCMTDSLAFGAISALWSEGLSVPGDVSVVGFDDVFDAPFATPPLTTVHFDRAQLARTALDLLTQRIADHERPVKRVTIPYRVIVRASTRHR